MESLEWFGRGVARAVLLGRRRRSAQWLTVLAYHRVSPILPGYPFDVEVIDCTPEQFERQMSIVSRYCTPIRIDQLIEFFAGAALPPNPVLVTFDDGYLDNREVALPILQQHHIPAVFFVATSYVTGRRTFWWDRLAYLFHETQVASATIRYPTDIVLRPRLEPGKSRRTALRLIKTCPGLDIERFLQELQVALRVPWDASFDEHVARQMVMTWDDIKALVAAGMEVGSHTRTHRVLDTVPPDELPQELREARLEIEAELSRPVRTISYPVGRSLSQFPCLLRAVREAGFSLGFSVQGHSCRLERTLEPFDLPRLSVDHQLSCDRFTALLAAPELSRW